MIGCDEKIEEMVVVRIGDAVENLLVDSEGIGSRCGDRSRCGNNVIWCYLVVSFLVSGDNEYTMNFNPKSGKWINAPLQNTTTEHAVEIVTEPNTDFWQRTYYGFRNDNAPALLFNSSDNYTFTSKVNFNYKKQFDQCGLIVHIDSDNWFKCAIEFENNNFSRLGSVVTNFGYSDWSSTNVSLPGEIWYRLSRRGPDFLIESSIDGQHYSQMRIFHLHVLGVTTEDMGKQKPDLKVENRVRFGLYACSPVDSTFTARFTDFKLAPCSWVAHSAQ